MEKLKQQSGSPSLLPKHVEGEVLILYLVVSEYFISAVFIREEGKVQFPVYYVSKRLLDVETRYTNMEKLAYTLIRAARKLRPYFQAHKVEHIRGGFQARGPQRDLYMRYSQELMNKFKEVHLEQIPRLENSNFNALAKLGSQKEATLLCVIPLEVYQQPSTPKIETARVDTTVEGTWMSPIYDYITKGILPEGKKEERKLNYKAARYYAKGTIGLVYKRIVTFTQGPVITVKGKGGVKYAVVAVDYFFKWAEAEPLATIIAAKLKEFVFRAIVCRYGVPYKFISENGKQFNNKEMKQLCEDLHIKKGFSEVCYPQSNGQTEAINKIIKHTLKVKLEESKGCCPEELPRVLWSYSTIPQTTTCKSPFRLTCGFEAMVPVEIGSGSFRRENYDPDNNELNHHLYLDLLEEVHENS
ncbi:uncharacterized protein LOC141665260 [Apium graveolens]|uniref:uncharacterized protein LOC141665260 n=1 Tax=Apium graveolens TaxID=4045 RepID=UPI003D7AE568